MQLRPIPQRALYFLGAAAVLAVAACSSSSSSTPHNTAATHAPSSTMGTQPLVVESTELSPLTDTFNPLSATESTGFTLHADNLIYEPLFDFNLQQPTQAPVPMLATAYSWSSDGKTLTLTTRSGVKWNDGQPFSAADVAFTFNLIKQDASTADQNGTPAPTSATTTGPNTAVITFATPQAGNFYAIGTQQIVPQHIWKSVNPATYADASPVGTGPYTLGNFSAQKITLKYNPNYWDESEIHVPEVIFPGFASGTSSTAVEAGSVDWAGDNIPNVQSVFAGANPSTNHLWLSATPYFAANNVVTLWFNTTKAPLNDPQVRLAVSDAIDRQQLGTQGESGYEAAATSSSGLLPSDQSQISSQYASNLTPAGNASQAASVLTSDGWKKVGGKWTKNGQQITFTIIDPSGYTDYYTDEQLVAKQLDAQGFNVSAQGIGNPATWTTDIENGDFDATIHWSAGPINYGNFDQWMDDTTTAAIGTPASGDWGRFKDPAAQTALAALAAGTTQAAQQSALNSLQQIMATQVPETPLLYGALWAEWSSKNYTGWPTSTNSYADPGPSNNQDVEYVLLHLTPVS
jgi:peptide/nickel transport system substrate-binding protein